MKHDLVIKCANAGAARSDRRFRAVCSCGWTATGRGEKGAVRVERKADEHLRGAR